MAGLDPAIHVLLFTWLQRRRCPARHMGDRASGRPRHGVRRRLTDLNGARGPRRRPPPHPLRLGQNRRELTRSPLTRHSRACPGRSRMKRFKRSPRRPHASSSDVCWRKPMPGSALPKHETAYPTISAASSIAAWVSRGAGSGLHLPHNRAASRLVNQPIRISCGLGLSTPWFARAP